MPHSLEMPWPPPPEGTPLDSREWEEWKREISDWYYAVLADIGTEPWLPQGSVPSVRRRR